jgi:hypothetical protein
MVPPVADIVLGGVGGVKYLTTTIPSPPPPAR